MLKVKELVLRELLWLFAAVVAALLLALVLEMLLRSNWANYSLLLQDLEGSEAALKLLCWTLCFAGVYVARLAVAAVGALIEMTSASDSSRQRNN